MKHLPNFKTLSHLFPIINPQLLNPVPLKIYSIIYYETITINILFLLQLFPQFNPKREKERSLSNASVYEFLIIKPFT